ncbi:hypothetical protein AGMMS49587_19870 [Spirochaetia bacterium]|nr:hypothetical protein AGMMS49587_19870 [Spirochaetia bacterium]
MAEYKILSFADKVERKAIREERKKIARNLKAQGVAPEKIAAAIGLPPEEIKKL